MIHYRECVDNDNLLAHTLLMREVFLLPSLCFPLYSVPSLLLKFLHPQGCNLLSEHLLTHLRTEKSFARISALACAPPLKLLSLRWFFNYMPADKIMVDESPIKCVWVILSYRLVCGISDFSFHTLMEFMTSLMEVRLTPPFIPFQLPPLYASNVKVQR